MSDKTDWLLLNYRVEKALAVHRSAGHLFAGPWDDSAVQAVEQIVAEHNARCGDRVEAPSWMHLKPGEHGEWEYRDEEGFVHLGEDDGQSVIGGGMVRID
jgi:hypothetical protein